MLNVVLTWYVALSSLTWACYEWAKICSNSRTMIKSLSIWLNTIPFSCDPIWSELSRTILNPSYSTTITITQDLKRMKKYSMSELGEYFTKCSEMTHTSYGRRARMRWRKIECIMSLETESLRWFDLSISAQSKHPQCVEPFVMVWSSNLKIFTRHSSKLLTWSAPPSKHRLLNLKNQRIALSNIHSLVTHMLSKRMTHIYK